MAGIKETREKRDSLLARMKELQKVSVDENRGFSTEEQANWDQLNTDYDAAGKELDAEQKRLDDQKSRTDFLENQEREAAKNRNSRIGRDDVNHRGHGTDGESEDEDFNLALQGWCRQEVSPGPSERHEEAAKRLGINLRAKQFSLRLASDPHEVINRYEKRTLQLSTPTAGGYLRAPAFMPNLEKALLAFGSVRGVARIIRTDTGANMPWPVTNDTGNSGVRISDTAAATETAPTFGAVELNAYEYTSYSIIVSNWLLNDSAFNLAGEIGSMLGERLARKQNTDLTTGTGAGEPQGIVTGATLGKTAASATAITFDELMDLQHSVDPAYRPSARWMMHDSIFKAIRQLKDGEGRYLWQADTTAGGPGTILGQGMTVNQQMASSLAASAKTILYGDFSKYLVREVNEVVLKRFDELYGLYNQAAFVAFMRFDGKHLDAGTHPIKYLAQA